MALTEREEAILTEAVLLNFGVTQDFTFKEAMQALRLSSKLAEIERSRGPILAITATVAVKLEPAAREITLDFKFEEDAPDDL